MATKLVKPLSREIVIQDNFGKTGVAIVTIFHDRIELRKKGTSRRMSCNWTDLGKILKIPLNAGAKYAQNSLGWIVEE